MMSADLFFYATEATPVSSNRPNAFYSLIYRPISACPNILQRENPGYAAQPVVSKLHAMSYDDVH
ncbi:hypothetical protein WJ63_17785 [Burkholderia pyrrocinia]|nr:hypothetical protein WJ63_17785 [Burkholderia pyrrocinia]